MRPIDYFDPIAEVYGARTALVDGNVTLTFADLTRVSEALGRAVANAGRAGDAGANQKVWPSTSTLSRVDPSSSIPRRICVNVRLDHQAKSLTVAGPTSCRGTAEVDWPT